VKREPRIDRDRREDRKHQAEAHSHEHAAAREHRARANEHDRQKARAEERRARRGEVHQRDTGRVEGLHEQPHPAQHVLGSAHAIEAALDDVVDHRGQGRRNDADPAVHERPGDDRREPDEIARPIGRMKASVQLKDVATLDIIAGQPTSGLGVLLSQAHLASLKSDLCGGALGGAGGVLVAALERKHPRSRSGRRGAVVPLHSMRDVHAVSTGALGLIQRLVGGGEGGAVVEGLAGHGAGHPEGDGGLDLAHAELRDGAPQLVREGHAGLGFIIGQQQDELLAPESINGVGRADGFGELLCDGVQHCVADAMPVGVVDDLEVIDVPQQESDVPVGDRRLVLELGDARLQRAAVQHAGELVDHNGGAGLDIEFAHGGGRDRGGDHRGGGVDKRERSRA
jgi:hypothetical protein